MTAAGRTLLGIALAVTLLMRSSPAAAGPTDTPLPTFADGKPAVAVDIGVEVFDETGALRNSPAANDTERFSAKGE